MCNNKLVEALEQTRNWIVNSADKDEYPEEWAIVKRIDYALSSRPDDGWVETALGKIAHPTAAAGEGLTLRDVEAQTIELMEKASQREGMKLNDWVAHRLRTIAERALYQPAADGGAQ